MCLENNQLLTFLQESDLSIWTYDIKTDTYHFLNSEYSLQNLGVMEDGKLEDLKNLMGAMVYEELIEKVKTAKTSADAIFKRELVVHHESGKYTYLISGYPSKIDEQGMVSELSGTLMDISFVKEIQAELTGQVTALENALKVKDRFLSHVSHELRTPLNGIAGMMQLLYLTKLDDEQMEYLRVLRTASNKMNRLINNLIQYTLLFSQETSAAVYKKVYLRDLFRQLLDTQKSDLIDKQLVVEISISPLVDGEIIIDSSNLEMVLDQAIDNAVKFSREGQIFINASVDEETGKMLQIEVIDEGVGFNPADLKLDQSGFTQIDDGLTKEFGGLGLGLPILTKICEQTGILYQINSKRGFGTKVCLTMPYCFEDETSQERPEMLQLLHSKKALVVDDDENGRVLLSLLCKKSGLEVEVASGGREALEIAAKRDFDLIYLDIQMPELNGMDVLKQIRSSDTNANVPIIAVTAYALKGDEERFISSGFDGYIAKPVEFNRFEQTTKKALQSRY